MDVMDGSNTQGHLHGVCSCKNLMARCSWVSARLTLNKEWKEGRKEGGQETNEQVHLKSISSHSISHLLNIICITQIRQIIKNPGIVIGRRSLDQQGKQSCEAPRLF